MSESIFCEICDKVLSQQRGEYDHGCLDCHGQPYANKIFWLRKDIKAKYQTIKQLEDALRDMGKTLEFYGKWSSYSQGANFDSNGRYIINSDASYVDDNPPFRSCVYAGGKRARETLQKHSELLSKINKEKKG
jgi:hypothetical protein